MNIAVVDDHNLVREGLNAILSRRDGYDIGKFATGAALLDCLHEGKRFDLYVLDLELPDIDGFELIDKLRQSDPETPIIVSTNHDEVWTLRKLIALDVNAIIYKSADGKEIHTAIDRIRNGKRYYCDEALKAMEAASETSIHPSARELQVLQLIAHGKTSKEIAEKIFISDNTVEAHRKALMAKLCAVNAADLIYKAFEKGYLQH